VVFDCDCESGERFDPRSNHTIAMVARNLAMAKTVVLNGHQAKIAETV